MITRIELRNFMSHRHTVIEPAAGLTVLVGPNNVGKSAVVAALQILCHNENSTYVMRHGERECSVRVHTDDGHDILWRRRNSPGYEIDGKIFDRLRGSGLPDELHAALRLPSVDAGGDADFDVHFGTQKSPIFLLGSSASNAARFFASSSDANQLMAMQKRHREKLSDAQKEKTRLEAESKQLNAELEWLEPVVEVEDRLRAVELAYVELQKATKRLDDAENHAKTLHKQTTERDRRAEQFAALAPLSSPPELIPTEPLERHLGTWEKEEAKRRTSAALSESLQMLTTPPEPIPVQPLADWMATVEKLTSSRDAAAARATKLHALNSPPLQHDVASLHRLIEQMESSEQRKQFDAARTGAIEPLASPPVIAEETTLLQLVVEMEQASSQVKREEHCLVQLTAVESPPTPLDPRGLQDTVVRYDHAESVLTACRSELASVIKEYDIASAELRESSLGKNCPMCGAPLDPDRLLESAALGREEHRHA